MADSEVNALAAVGTLTGAELLYLEQGGIGKKATLSEVRSIDVVKALTATQANTTTTGAAITEFTTSLDPGTYEIKCTLIWQSAATTTGAGFWVNCSGGTSTLNVGHVYTTTTGGTATTGIADQATVAATFQMIEARAWRTNNTDPGPFAGTDTASAHQYAVLECTVIVTATTSLQIMFDSEVAASGITMQVGSSMKIVKSA